MTAFRRGEVILVPFEYTDRSGTKWRPAIVISSDAYDTTTPDLVIASVTGNLRAIPHPGDHLLHDWKAAGLLRPSLTQTKLATIEASMVGGRLDSLSQPDMQALGQGIRVALQL